MNSLSIHSVQSICDLPQLYISQRHGMNLPRVRNFNFSICIFGTGTAFPNPSLRSFEVFHGLKKAKLDFHATEKHVWSTTFYMTWVWRVSWWRSRTVFFLVDGEKHIKCIEICILDLKYPKSTKITSICDGSEPPEGAPPTSGLLLESHLNFTCERNS